MDGISRDQRRVVALAAQLASDGSPSALRLAINDAAGRLGIKHISDIQLDMVQAQRSINQQLFSSTESRETETLQVAAELMDHFEAFRPLLVSPIPGDTATEPALIILHVFSDEETDVAIAAQTLDRQHGEQAVTIRWQSGESLVCPQFLLDYQGHDCRISLLPLRRRSQSPLNPFTRKTRGRINRKALKKLLGQPETSA